MHQLVFPWIQSSLKVGLLGLAWRLNCETLYGPQMSNDLRDRTSWHKNWDLSSKHALTQGQSRGLQASDAMLRSSRLYTSYLIGRPQQPQVTNDRGKTVRSTCCALLLATRGPGAESARPSPPSVVAFNLLLTVGSSGPLTGCGSEVEWPSPCLNGLGLGSVKWSMSHFQCA